MKCKHENADHLMPGDYYSNGRPFETAVVLVEQFRCLDCEAWLSLGPSRDNVSNVRVRILAAVFAQKFAEGEISREQLLAYQMDASDLALAIIDHGGEP